MCEQLEQQEKCEEYVDSYNDGQFNVIDIITHILLASEQPAIQ